VVPNLRHLAVIGNVGFSDSAREMSEVEGLARRLGLDVLPFELTSAKDIATFFARTGKADALYVVTDAFVSNNRMQLIALALQNRLPTVFNTRIYVLSGGLMSYGANFENLFRRAAGYVDRILRGAKPSDLPVEQPTKFELAFNLKTAKALELTIPSHLLAIADEVIE